MPETIKLLGCTKIKIIKVKNDKNCPHLEITEVVLIHCSIAKNDYQQNSRALYKYVPNQSFDQLPDISPKHLTFLKIFNS